MTKLGNLVFCELTGQSVSINDSWGSVLLGNLPQNFKPLREVIQPCMCENGTSTTVALWVRQDGRLLVANFGNTPPGTQNVSCTMTWKSL